MVLVAVVLLNLAMVVVYMELASVRLRYACVREEEHARSLALENRLLLGKVARAHGPGEISRSSHDGGIRVRQVRQEDVEGRP